MSSEIKDFYERYSSQSVSNHQRAQSWDDAINTAVQVAYDIFKDELHTEEFEENLQDLTFCGVQKYTQKDPNGETIVWYKAVIGFPDTNEYIVCSFGDLLTVETWWNEDWNTEVL